MITGYRDIGLSRYQVGNHPVNPISQIYRDAQTRYPDIPISQIYWDAQTRYPDIPISRYPDIPISGFSNPISRYPDIPISQIHRDAQARYLDIPISRYPDILDIGISGYRVAEPRYRDTRLYRVISGYPVGARSVHAFRPSEKTIKS